MKRLLQLVTRNQKTGQILDSVHRYENRRLLASVSNRKPGFAVVLVLEKELHRILETYEDIIQYVWTLNVNMFHSFTYTDEATHGKTR